MSTTRRDFLSQTAWSAAAAASASLLTSCGGSGDVLVDKVEFLYGIASGDPTPSSVILWTHAQVKDQEKDVSLVWQVASDSSFNTIVSSGTVSALVANGNTAKVDAGGLSAGKSYFYRFLYTADTSSPVGTTRTLPENNVSSVKLAVLSCALYPAGYFNVYESATHSGAEYALHLGDYIYEYGSNPTTYGNADAQKLGRVVQPANDLVSLHDYRMRYAQYRSDPMLQAFHAKMPMIATWDDHEFANNASKDDVENHNTVTQGRWQDRKAAAAKAYHEWLPIRTVAGDFFKIYRSFEFGNLFALHVLDTRIEGRTKQVYADYGDPFSVSIQPYDWTDYKDGVSTVNGLPKDAQNRLISDAQFNWLTSRVATSTAKWQVLGNQVIMARLLFPMSVVSEMTNQTTFKTAVAEYMAAKATQATAPAALTPRQKTILSDLVPMNLDSWDGYSYQRERLLRALQAAAPGKNLVALSGDSHNAWFNDLKSNDGSVKFGVEFGIPSVSSPGFFESAGTDNFGSALDGSANPLAKGSSGTGLGLMIDTNYAATARRGLVVVTVTSEAIQGEYVFIDTVKSKNYTAAVAKTIRVAAADMAVSYT